MKKYFYTDLQTSSNQLIWQNIIQFISVHHFINPKDDLRLYIGAEQQRNDFQNF